MSAFRGGGGRNGDRVVYIGCDMRRIPIIKNKNSEIQNGVEKNRLLTQLRFGSLKKLFNFLRGPEKGQDKGPNI